MRGGGEEEVEVERGVTLLWGVPFGAVPSGKGGEGEGATCNLQFAKDLVIFTPERQK